jgi:hypothetical protein
MRRQILVFSLATINIVLLYKVVELKNYQDAYLLEIQSLKEKINSKDPSEAQNSIESDSQKSTENIEIQKDIAAKNDHASAENETNDTEEKNSKNDISQFVNEYTQDALKSIDLLSEEEIQAMSVELKSSISKQEIADTFKKSLGEQKGSEVSRDFFQKLEIAKRANQFSEIARIISFADIPVDYIPVVQEAFADSETKTESLRLDIFKRTQELSNQMRNKADPNIINEGHRELSGLSEQYEKEQKELILNNLKNKLPQDSLQRMQTALDKSSSYETLYSLFGRAVN